MDKSAELPELKVFSQSPSEALRPFVKRFLVIEFPVAHNDSHLPDTGMVAAFQFKGGCRLYGREEAPLSGVTGLWDRTRSHEHAPNSGVVLALFTPAGASAVLRQPADEFFNATHAMTDVLPGRNKELEQIHERLALARNHASRVSVVENFMVGLVTDFRPDELVSEAVSRIQMSHGSVRMGNLARELGASQSSLERRFRQRVGTTPKKFASIVRLRRVLKLRAEGAELTSLAYEAGYFDQAHFIKDFKQITGMAPGSFAC